MFVGHYGPAFAGPRFAPVPLWALFVAVQFLDYLWGAFIALGIEHVRIEPGFTAMSPFDLYDMPWSHSLVMALAWSALLGLVWAGIAKRSKLAGGLVIAAAVLSHWLADLLVHVPDLPLWPGGPSVGFGLWNHVMWTLVAEFGVLIAGWLFYMSATRAKNAVGHYGPVILFALLAVVYWMSHASPPPTNPAVAGPYVIGVYTLLAFLAWLLCDRVREAR